MIKLKNPGGYFPKSILRGAERVYAERRQYGANTSNQSDSTWVYLPGVRDAGIGS